jgi:hypothetical protein
VVLSVNVDDYAEVWVDGQLNRRSGMPSPAIIQGMSTPNRVVLTDAAKPGDKFQIAVFGINGPISFAPSNFRLVPRRTRRVLQITTPAHAPLYDAVNIPSCPSQQEKNSFRFGGGVWRLRPLTTISPSAIT